MSPIELFIWVSCIVVLYGVLAYGFYIYRSTKYLKLQKEKFESIHQNIQVGKKVLLSSGLIGLITSINDEVINVELVKGMNVEASIYSVQSIIES